MTKILAAQLLILIAIALLLFNIAGIDLNNFDESNRAWTGAISNKLLILALAVSIREMKKSKN